MIRAKISVVLLGIILHSIAYTQSKVDNPYKIDSIKAFHYYNQNNSLKQQNVAGTYSPNIIGNNYFSLWNTIIGAGDAVGNSDQTLVIVEISGNPNGYVQRQLHFRAIADGKVIFNKTISFAIVDFNDKYYAAFVLYETGCQEIKLVASIMGKKEESRLEKTIHFKCGE